MYIYVYIKSLIIKRIYIYVEYNLKINDIYKY